MHPDDLKKLLEQGTQPLLGALRAAGAPMNFKRAKNCIKNGNGGVRLAAVKIGGRWETSTQAVHEFIQRTTENALHVKSSPPRGTGTGARYLRSLGLDQAAIASQRGQPK